MCVCDPLILTQTACPTGFPWEDLPHESVLVDVGGGIGSQSILVAEAHPHIHVVVEDREQVASTASSVRHPLHLTVSLSYLI